MIKVIAEFAQNVIICKNCGSVLSYLKSDIQRHTYTDYIGCTDISNFIKCPYCEKRVVIHD